MAESPLSPDEAALWSRVLATVRPLAGERAVPVTAKVPAATLRTTPPSLSPPSTAKPARRLDDTTLDGTWDRQLARGTVFPDSMLDLHGDTLARAYARIDSGLERALARGDRVVLLVTGKPRETGSGRGAIRAAVGDWLAASRHADRIAAVRPAHPRHGGAGALYLVLRKR